MRFIKGENVKAWWVVPLLLMAASCAVKAQSAVALYGSIDVGFLLNSNREGSAVARLSDNGIRGNRLGVTGTEQLRGSNVAIFRLENGFNATTGTAAQGQRLFGSQAYVGLGNQLGALFAGRQINADVSVISVNFAASAQWAGVLGAHPADVDNLYGTFRVPAALKYVFRKPEGLEFQILYAPGGVTDAGSRAWVASAAVRYSGGPVSFGASYNNAHLPNVGLAAGTSDSGSTVDAGSVNYVSPVVSGFSSASTYQVFSVAASCTCGAVTLNLLYTNARFGNLGALGAGPNPQQYNGSAVFSTIEVSGRYSLSPSLFIGAAYAVTARNSVATAGVSDGLGGARYAQGTVAIQYFLQKAAFLYLEAMTQQASGTDSTGQVAVAANNALGPSSNAQQRAVRVGLNVSF
ncbi:porin [Caballeronia novacaledonica]|uniref:porin n=1 Tax=Caballeronia novacaledonica TaxID=1544861 RepID=UPI001EE1A716|nr:porin [Caballeronia novacaledonica]GJH13264.1 porin [Caballeronia novacaledonica]